MFIQIILYVKQKGIRFVMRERFGNMCTSIYCVFVLFVLCFCIVSLMCNNSFLFCLY